MEEATAAGLHGARSKDLESQEEEEEEDARGNLRMEDYREAPAGATRDFEDTGWMGIGILVIFKFKWSNLNTKHLGK